MSKGWLSAVGLMLLSSTGCCRLAHRWCDSPPPPAPVAAGYVQPGCVPCCPQPQACYPTTAGAPLPQQGWARNPCGY